MSHPLLPEQQDIVDAVTSKKYGAIIVQAVAGAGKTTTALAIAAALKQSGESIFLITYNRALKEEVGLRLLQAGADHARAFTYHGLAVYLYKRQCGNDEDMKAAMRDGDIDIASIALPDIIIVDEAQDMSHVLWQLICNLRRACAARLCGAPGQAKPIMVVMGDHNQAVYEGSMGADRRFLTLAPDLFESEGEAGALRLYIPTSFRVSRAIARVTNAMLGEDRIQLTPEKEKQEGVRPVELLRIRSDLVKCTLELDVCARIQHIVEDCGVKPRDIMVVARFVNTQQSIARRVACRISSVLKYDVLFNEENNARLSAEESKDKLVVCSLHASKGQERRVIVFLNYDDFLPDCMSQPEFCPPSDYVGVTRAKERLLLYCATGNNPPAYVRDQFLENAAFFSELIAEKHLVIFSKAVATKEEAAFQYSSAVEEGDIGKMVEKKKSKDSLKTPTDNVTQLLRSLHSSYEDELRALADSVLALSSEDDKLGEAAMPAKIRVKKKTGFGFNVEPVHVLNALVVTATFEAMIKGTPETFDKYLGDPFDFKSFPYDVWKHITFGARQRVIAGGAAEYVDETRSEASHLLEKVTVYQSLRQQLTPVYNQTRDSRFRWLDESVEEIGLCVKRLSRVFGESRDDLDFEEAFTISKEGCTAVHGVLDVIDVRNGVIGEIKCLGGDLSLHHKLQVLIYSHLVFEDERRRNVEPKPWTLILINVTTGETFRSDRADMQRVRDVAEKVFNIVVNGRIAPPPMSDEEFLKKIAIFV